MLVRFWRWLWNADEPEHWSPVEQQLTLEVEWLREELREANRRIYALTKRLGRNEERSAPKPSVDVAQEPITLRRKSMDQRRRELELASQKRLPSMAPETAATIRRWADKIDEAESDAFNELAEIEDKIHGESTEVQSH